MCKRVNPETVVDVDYRFNDNDARQVWQGMVNDATFRGWMDRWIQTHGGQLPKIIIGPIKNNTQDYINQNLFTRNFEPRDAQQREGSRGEQVSNERVNLRDERLQGQEEQAPLRRARS